jgi:hypothetical protein
LALLSSSKKEKRFCEINSAIGKETSGYKRRLEALRSKPDITSSLIQRALDKGMDADYVLMNNWFTHDPLIESITDKCLFVIGIIKQMKRQYYFNRKTFKT